jgi:hypothetical protein
MFNSSDALPLHDDLAETSTPFYFREFLEHAAAHRLQFLSEADLFESRMDGVPATAAGLFEAVADDPLAREQYMDFFKNRTFDGRCCVVRGWWCSGRSTTCMLISLRSRRSPRPRDSRSRPRSRGPGGA